VIFFKKNSLSRVGGKALDKEPLLMAERPMRCVLPLCGEPPTSALGKSDDRANGGHGGPSAP
jgi:hypothetical protein